MLRPLLNQVVVGRMGLVMLAIAIVMISIVVVMIVICDGVCIRAQNIMVNFSEEMIPNVARVEDEQRCNE